MRKIRLMLADDNALVREALAMLFAFQDDMEVVAQAVNGLDVLARVAGVRPDVVCMDINLGQPDGIETTRQLQLQQPGVKVIGLSADIEAARVAEMLQAGALGYVVKHRAASDLPALVRAVHQGKTPIRAQ